jgi:photosystem II stability/assembly factor-like uncharacterized protein
MFFYFRVFLSAIMCVFFCAPNQRASAQQIDASRYDCMRWRMIGPFRGGRTVGACGDAKHPNVFYAGVNDGGVWKSDDYGRTWDPIFDDQPTGSVGDVAVAPSNPNVVYVASGEGLQRPDLSVGDGMYKSIDAGKTWTHLGLHEGLQIGGLAVDPHNENRVFAAVLGHPYGPNVERGVYRSVDGGASWERVLYKNENTGAIQVTIDPSDPQVVYADLLAARMAPWENGEFLGAGSGLFKSTDGGTTWKQLTNGLPGVDSGLGRIGFCIAPSQHDRLYAVVSANNRNGGIYRSDDAGVHWRKINDDLRLWDRGIDFAELRVDPKNPDVLYDANVVVWKSTDGGKSWAGFKGAPGGDDYHRLWINPNDPSVILCANDQGVIVTVNGGRTWSSWYNQPTAQLYHVSADNAFPYNVYSGQQESGSVGIASRGNDGAVTIRDWHPVAAEEYGYVVADPLDANLIYGGKISRYDKRTGQSQNIAPEAIRSGRYRFLRTAPVLFSPTDPHTLYFAGNVLFRTRDGGVSWQVMSPDLARSSFSVPECVGVYKTADMEKMPARGVIYTLAPSPLDSDRIWAGTDDGLVWVTTDGGKLWNNITPPGVTPWSKVSLMDASHFHAGTAFAAVNRIRLDDYAPHIYRTSDGGASWKEVVAGLPTGSVNAVREDPLCPGLLFAGTEQAVFVSFDSGDHWQPLRLNMPATSIRDVIIKDNDLVVATHGRSFWILDDITPLRQLWAIHHVEGAVLYRPQDQVRVRWNMNTDTPWPADEPTGKNPPDGAMIDYVLPAGVKKVRLTIRDSIGNIVRVYQSNDTLLAVPTVNIPLYWVRPSAALPAGAGSHRFVWDMHYQPLELPVSYAMNAITGDTPPDFNSPWVMPGQYTAELWADGKAQKQEFHILKDPRVGTTLADFRDQFECSYACYRDVDTLLKIKKATMQTNGIMGYAGGDDDEEDHGVPATGKAAEIDRMVRSLMQVEHLLQQADLRPTDVMREAQHKLHSETETFLKASLPPVFKNAKH